MSPSATRSLQTLNDSREQAARVAHETHFNYPRGPVRFTPIELSLPSAIDDETSGRHSGVHVSSCIKHLLLQLDPDKYNSIANDEVRLLWEMGLAWEDLALSRAFWRRILKRKYPKASFKQVQAQCDDIWGTCDMLGLGSRRLIVESKLTQLSMSHDIAGVKFWSWRVQMMAYCHMWGARNALLPVCFLNGDYKPKKIVPRAWDVTFKRSEIAANWSMMLQARDEILATKKGKR